MNLGHFEGLELLDDAELSKFRYICYAKSNLIYANNIKFIILKKGRAKLSYFENGKEFIMHYLDAGNMVFLDESCVCEILEDSEVYELSLFHLEKLIENGNFTMSLLNSLLRSLLLNRQILKEVVFCDIQDRLLLFLQNLALEQDEIIDGLYCVTLPFSVKILADFLGFKRQSVSTALNKLIKDGLLRKFNNHKFLIIT